METSTSGGPNVSLSIGSDALKEVTRLDLRVINTLTVIK